MTPMPHRSLPFLALLAVAAAFATPARANDFPTVERVLWVEECIRLHPGPYFEMVNKCSCAVDALATAIRFDEYTTMQTIGNGLTIGGERGNSIREVAALRPELKRYRDLQQKVKTGCFIGEPK